VQTWFFFFIIAPIPRRPLSSEKKFKTLNVDGDVTDPAPLPCWLDQIDERRRKEQKDGHFSLESIPIDPAELFMSVVVPAFNEQDRLVGMLEEAVNYLGHEYGILSERADAATKENGTPIRRRPSGQTEINGQFPEKSNPRSVRGWEILLIDDGSTDATVQTALTFARTHQLPLRPRRQSGPWSHRADRAVNIPPGSIRLVSLAQNRGKGGAVTHGMRHARGQYIVFADADGASKFDDLGRLLSACQRLESDGGDSSSSNGERAVAVGSRAHLVGSEAVVRRSKLRNLLMHSFHLLLKWMTPPRTAAIRDTQCGFKLFSRAALPHIVPYMHCEGWIFDVEMLMLAEFAGIPVVEVPVGWREVKGSKLNVLWDSLGMAWGLAVLRVCWAVGIYRRD
jgi:dolichyl-phosphate beta-glucosyltransferase